MADNLGSQSASWGDGSTPQQEAIIAQKRPTRVHAARCTLRALRRRRPGSQRALHQHAQLTQHPSASDIRKTHTQGGGHAFIGYHLAKQLIAKGHDVTIFNDGDEAKLSAKAPFNQYASLKGLKVKYGSPTDYAQFPEGPFDVVYDNNGKDLDTCKPLIDAAKVRR